MKFFKSLLSLLFIGTMTLGACASRPANTETQQPQTNNNDMKSVIIYFTHSGNTELAAKEIAAVTGAKMIRLMPEQPYTTEDVDWENEKSRCTQEHLNPSLRPAIKPVDVNFADVDTVFIGFPIWWHEEPAVIRTLLDNYRTQLKGKVIYPFCTSYESPIAEADATLRKGYPELDWKNGLRLPSKPDQIQAWIAQ